MCISETWPLKIRIILIQIATEIFGTTRKTLMAQSTANDQPKQVATLALPLPQLVHPKTTLRINPQQTVVVGTSATSVL